MLLEKHTAQYSSCDFHLDRGFNALPFAWSLSLQASGRTVVAVRDPDFTATNTA